MPQGGGQQPNAPSQGGWQQIPVPEGPVQQPNFNDPAFQQARQPQRQAPTPAGIPPMQQQYDGGAVQMPAPSFPQSAQQPTAPAQFRQVGTDAQGQPLYAPVVQPSQQVPNQGWQQPQAQPVQRAAAPMLQQQQGAQVNIDANGRLSGPGVPPELQGRTLAEGLQSYGMMRQVVLQGQQRPAPQVQQQAPQGATPAQQVGAAAQPKSFWADPEGAIERIVDQRLAPVTQQSQLQAVQGARDTVAAQFPQFSQYEGLVLQKMQGLSPDVLANPKAWEIAFQQVVGEVALSGGRFPTGGQQQANGHLQQPANNGWQPYTQGQQNPQGGPRLGDFFTEAPAANFAGNAPNDGTYGLTPAQQEVARRFGYSNEQYARGAGMIP